MCASHTKYRTQKYKRAKRNESHLWLAGSFILFIHLFCFFSGLCGIEWIEDRALQILLCCVAQISKLLAASIMNSALSHKHTKYIVYMHNNCWKRFFFPHLFFLYYYCSSVFFYDDGFRARTEDLIQNSKNGEKKKKCNEIRTIRQPIYFGLHI